MFPVPSARRARCAVVAILTGSKVRSAPIQAAAASLVSTWSLAAIDAATFGDYAFAVGTADASIAAGTPNLTSPDGLWTAADVGKSIAVAGAGPANAVLSTTILAYGSPTAVTLAANASTTVSASDTSAAGIAVWGKPATLEVPADPPATVDGNKRLPLNITAADVAALIPPFNVGALTGLVGFLGVANAWTDAQAINALNPAFAGDALAVEVGNVTGQPRLAAFRRNGYTVHELFPARNDVATQNLCVYNFDFDYQANFNGSATYHELYTDIRVAAGKINNGEHLASYIQHNRNISKIGDSGTLNSLKGLQISIGHDLIDGAATPVTNEVTAVYLRLKANTGTIGNMFGLRIAYQGPVPVSTHISGGLWGIFADDARVNHAFAGKSVFGASGTPAEVIDVQAGNIRFLGTLGNTLQVANVVAPGGAAVALGNVGPVGVTGAPQWWVRVNINGTYNGIMPVWQYNS